MEPLNEKEESFLEVYDAYADAVYRRCFFKVSDKEKAKDITQESFVKLWDYYRNGEDIRNGKALVFRIANNLIIDSYRKKESESLDFLALGGLDPSEDDHEHIVDASDKFFALKIINELPDIYQEAVTLRYVEEMSPTEIAEIIGETENVVSVRIHRGVKMIKDLLGEKENKENNEDQF